MAEIKRCFVIAPIGELDSATRKRSDKILKHVIRPATAECGYHTTRADEISEPGLITSQIIQHIVDDALVIADLTEWNPNVFYELAVRHALRKPFIQIIEKGQRIPFDVASLRTIQLDHTDLDSVEIAKTEIIAHIRHLESSDTPIESPISTAIDLQSLRSSGQPVERSLAALQEAVSELAARTSSIMGAISSISSTIDQSAYQSLMFGQTSLRGANWANMGKLHVGSAEGTPFRVYPHSSSFFITSDGTLLPIESSEPAGKNENTKASKAKPKGSDTASKEPNSEG